MAHRKIIHLHLNIDHAKMLLWALKRMRRIYTEEEGRSLQRLDDLAGEIEDQMGPNVISRLRDNLSI